MEGFFQITQNVKDRFTNPLIFSFAISWIFFNWEVVLALFWYDSELGENAYQMLITLIKAKTSNSESFFYPVTFAFAYTLLAPVVKNLVTAFQTWNTKWGGNWALKISKGSNVPIEKHLQLRKSYAERTDALEEIIKTESTTQASLDNIQSALLDARNQQNTLAAQLSEQRAISDNLFNMSFINGNWIKTYVNPLNDKPFIENMEIQSGTVYEHQGTKRNEQFHIQNFVYDMRAKRVSFCLFYYKKAGVEGPDGFYSFNDLRYEHRNLVGTEYRNQVSSEVTYSRP